MQSQLQEFKRWPVERRAKFLARLDPRELREFEVLVEGLQDFIPRISLNLKAPRHLQSLTELLESTTERERRAVVSTPPQHGKTVCGLHSLAWLLRREPKRRHAYVTYEATRAEQISLQVMHVALEAGLKFDGSRKVWRTKEGGGLIATGIGGPLTGYGVDGLMLVDDPVKNRAEAESAIFRERTDQWFRDVALTRVHPGASVVVVQTRWHEDDLAGRLIKRGWERLNLPAINDEGAALWPEERPADWLKKVRADIGEYAWWSLYQGEPRPRGGALFGDAVLYKELPKEGGFKHSIGVDLAYSAKTHADYSVAVTLMRVQDKTNPAAPAMFYVVDVRRQQVQAPAFKATLRQVRGKYPNAPMRWYAAGVEKGVGDFIRAPEAGLPGVPLEVVPAKNDKFVRAQPVAAAWNAGRVLVPESAPWATALLDELSGFTGVNDVHDDQVDALAAAYDLLVGPVNTSGRPITSPLSMLG